MTTKADVVDELVAAIASDPADEAPQLVIADHLQAAGDPRGELIALDRAERAGLLDDPAALEQLLLLAAEYSFPRAEAEQPRMRFDELGPGVFEGWHAGKRYEVQLNDHGWSLVIDIGDGYPEHVRELGPFDPRCFELLSDIIRAETSLDDARFEFDGIQIPLYDGGPYRCYQLPLDFLIPRGYLRNRFGLAARDYHRWHALWQRLRAMQPAEDEF